MFSLIIGAQTVTYSGMFVKFDSEIYMHALQIKVGHQLCLIAQKKETKLTVFVVL